MDCALGAAEPANPKANRAARALLDYFHGLAGRSDHKILSGQLVDFGNGANLKLMEAIHEKPGEWPAKIGVDYADFGRGGITTKIPNQAAIAYGNHPQPSRRLRLPQISERSAGAFPAHVLLYVVEREVEPGSEQLHERDARRSRYRQPG